MILSIPEAYYGIGIDRPGRGGRQDYRKQHEMGNASGHYYLSNRSRYAAARGTVHCRAASV